MPKKTRSTSSKAKLLSSKKSLNTTPIKLPEERIEDASTVNPPQNSLINVNIGEAWFDDYPSTPPVRDTDSEMDSQNDENENLSSNLNSSQNEFSGKMQTLNVTAEKNDPRNAVSDTNGATRLNSDKEASKRPSDLVNSETQSKSVSKSKKRKKAVLNVDSNLENNKSFSGTKFEDSNAMKKHEVSANKKGRVGEQVEKSVESVEKHSKNSSSSEGDVSKTVKKKKQKVVSDDSVSQVERSKSKSADPMLDMSYEEKYALLAYYYENRFYKSCFNPEVFVKKYSGKLRNIRRHIFHKYFFVPIKTALNELSTQYNVTLGEKECELLEKITEIEKKENEIFAQFSAISCKYLMRVALDNDLRVFNSISKELKPLKAFHSLEDLKTTYSYIVTMLDIFGADETENYLTKNFSFVNELESNVILNLIKKKSDTSESPNQTQTMPDTQSLVHRVKYAIVNKQEHLTQKDYSVLIEAISNSHGSSFKAAREYLEPLMQKYSSDYLESVYNKICADLETLSISELIETYRVRYDDLHLEKLLNLAEKNRSTLALSEPHYIYQESEEGLIVIWLWWMPPGATLSMEIVQSPDGIAKITMSVPAPRTQILGEAEMKSNQQKIAVFPKHVYYLNLKLPSDLNWLAPVKSMTVGNCAGYKFSLLKNSSELLV